MQDTSALEYSLAATVCLEPKRVLQLRQIVSVEDFSISACAMVFDAADSAVSRGKAFDVTLPPMVSVVLWTIPGSFLPIVST